MSLISRWRERSLRLASLSYVGRQMSVTECEFTRAFEVFQDPKRKRRVEVEWRETMPDIDPKEFPALLARCEEVVVCAVKLWYDIYGKRLGEGEAWRRFVEKYACLSSQVLRRTWTQAAYDAAT